MKKHKLYAIVNRQDAKKIIETASDFFGLPKIKNRLNIYGKINSNPINIKMEDEIVSVKFSGENEFLIENKSLKYFFRTINSLNIGKISIGEVTIYEYTDDENNLAYFQDSFLGDLIEIIISEDKKELLIRKFDFIEFVSKDRLPINTLDNFNEELFDGTGFINNKIKLFSDKNGFDIFSDSNTYESRLEAISNDYSSIEKLYNDLVGTNLISRAPMSKSFEFKPMSIIIPSYNSENEIEYILASIQSQNLSATDKNKIQVIIIDDGSESRIEDTVSAFKISFDFELQIIRLKNNSDLSFGRNIGVASSKYDILLFIDSDILLTDDYLYEHNVRNQIIDNAVFVSMRKNITKDSELLNLENIMKGLKVPEKIDDSRIINFPKDGQIGWADNFDPDRRLEILEDSNYFKNLGKGSKIGAYDLPGVLSGHNFSLNKSRFLKTGGFNVSFKGWGLEDKFFAAKFVCDGNFIIPVLSASVYHISYGPRGGDNAKKIKELKDNYDVYQKLILKKWNA